MSGKMFGYSQEARRGLTSISVRPLSRCPVLGGDRRPARDCCGCGVGGMFPALPVLQRGCVLAFCGTPAFLLVVQPALARLPGWCGGTLAGGACGHFRWEGLLLGPALAQVSLWPPGSECSHLSKGNERKHLSGCR